MDHALKTGCPLIGINDGGGARIQEGVVSLGLFAEIFHRNVTGLRRHPADLADHGRRARVAQSTRPRITDFIVMVEETSHMFITGPDVIKTVTGEDVTIEDLGGAHTHSAKSGVAHYQASDEQDCLDFARDLLSYLPLEQPRRPAARDRRPRADRGQHRPTRTRARHAHPRLAQPALRHARGDHPRARRRRVPRGPRGFRAEHRVGFGRVDGRPVGVVANQPMHFAGCLDINASEKAARFVRTCDASTSRS